MRAFLAIKFHDDTRNKALIEKICASLKKINIDTYVFVRDFEDYKPWQGTPQELMKYAFEEIEKSDILIVEASESSIGIGIESCYAFMKNIPVYVIAKKSVQFSSTIKGIAKDCFLYDTPNELQSFFKKVENKI